MTLANGSGMFGFEVYPSLAIYNQLYNIFCIMHTKNSDPSTSHAYVTIMFRYDAMRHQFEINAQITRENFRK